MATEEIQAAINAGILTVLQGGQRFRLADGQEVQRADLDKLLAARRELNSQAAEESDGLAFFQGPVGFGRVS
jgi:hypothetical protein